MADSETLKALRAELANHGVEGFILPSTDPFSSEYAPPHFRRLEWLTGFSGSFGIAVVLPKKSALFTDGRYTLQAKGQVPKSMQVFNINEVKPWAWLEKEGRGFRLGYDPFLHTPASLHSYKEHRIELVGLQRSPVDAIWKKRPAFPTGKIMMYPTKYAGESAASKRKDLAKTLKEGGVDAVLLTAPESVCWLLNLRGKDVPNTPVVLCYAVAYANGEVHLFLDEHHPQKPLLKALGRKISIYSLKELKDYFNRLDINIIVIPSSTPQWFVEQIKPVVKKVTGSDPCTLPKALKNKTEIKGMVQAHEKDGVAVTSFLYWLKHQSKKITELDISDKLLELRAAQEGFQGASFDTIAGFGAHGAIVHYRATSESASVIQGNNLLLVDSGGQYLGGTTDITRTVAIGCVEEIHKRHFTLVLKGHIALARARFPYGTTGSQLDALARQYLWAEGLDYDHGTGHGVSSFMGVHEGPQRISKLPNHVALQPGMILSNEPGYYAEGKYGIRIENLVQVIELKTESKKPCLGFHTITLVPFDLSLVEWRLITEEEKQWLRHYHARVFETIAPALPEEEKAWLKQVCSVG